MRPEAAHAYLHAMERVLPTTGDVPFAVFVDGARTPEALERALAEVRAAAKGRVVCVLGCGAHDDPATCAPRFATRRGR